MPASPHGTGRPATPPSGPQRARQDTPPERDEARRRRRAAVASLLTVSLITGLSIAELEPRPLWRAITLTLAPTPLVFGVLGPGRRYRRTTARWLLTASLVAATITIVAYTVPGVPSGTDVGYTLLTAGLLLILILYQAKRTQSTP